MPSTSAKQHRFMEAVAHDKKFADKVDVPQSVGRDFSEADKRKKQRKKQRDQEAAAAKAQAMTVEMYRALYGSKS